MNSLASESAGERPTSFLDVLRNTSVIIPCLFACFAAFLLLARSHFYSTPIQTIQTIAIGLGTILGIGCLRGLCGLPSKPARSPLAKWGWYLQTLTLLQVSLLLTVTSAYSEATAIIWVLSVVNEVVWWTVNGRQTPPVTTNPAETDHVIEEDIEARLLSSLGTSDSVDSPVGAVGTSGEIAAQTNQSWIRSRDEYGESISASQRTLFAAGQRFQTIHLAFIPELPGIPHVDVTSLEGPSVEIMVGEVQGFGLRLELKLTQIYDEPVEVVIQVKVFAESSQAA